MWGKSALGLLAVWWLLAADTATGYRYPMDGLYTLSGTFGELRNNHFHSGIDIRTNQRTGYPVYAIDDGYVYRIKVSPFGFGLALYLKHPDGNFSVYAHLDRFIPAYETEVKQRQAADEQFIQEIYPDPGQIPVKKGQLIAWSGNSGSSYGPHLHFEIRDSLERILNPLVWYRGQIADQIPPTVTKIALEPLTDSSLVGGFFSKKILTPTGAPGSYTVSGIVRVTGPFGIEYLASDRMNNNSSPCGIQQAEVFVDGEKIFSRNLTRFAFDETRSINVHMDYPWFRATKQRFERAYREPGNAFPDLVSAKGGGWISLPDEQPHQLLLVLTDFHGNATRVSLTVKKEAKPAFEKASPFTAGPAAWQVRTVRNVMVIKAIRPTRAVLTDGLRWMLANGTMVTDLPDFRRGDTLYFFREMRPGAWPVEIRSADGAWRYDTRLAAWVNPVTGGRLTARGVDVVFAPNSVFGGTPVQMQDRSGPGHSVWAIGEVNVPVYQAFKIKMAPPARVDTQCLVVAYRPDSKAKWEFMGADRSDPSWIQADANAFGEFTLVADSTYPSLTALNFAPGKAISSTQNSLRFQGGDNFSGIDAMTIRGELNGKWIPVSFNFKNNTLTWDYSGARPPAGPHALSIRLTDKAGNTRTVNWQVTF